LTKMTYPSVTINIAIYNEEHRIRRALDSIMMQDYPRELLQIIVVDGGSTDRSVEICRAYPCTILHNPKRDGSSGRRLGCEHSSGELHIYMDADMEWSHPSCLTQLVRPFIEVPGLVGSFPRFAVDAHDPAFNRCLSRHPLQQDPIFRFFSVQVEDTVYEDRGGYALCRFKQGGAPVLGMVLYRTGFLKQLLQEWGASYEWCDVDFAHECSVRGLTPLAYVPSAGVFHRGYMSPRIYLRKRRRDIRWSYLGTLESRRGAYLNWTKPADLLRLAAWILYVNSVLPGVAKAGYKAIKFRDAAMLYEAFMETIGTDYVILQFLLDERGRRLAGKAALALLTGGASRGRPQKGIREDLA
jgi:glycosyltransferase involved in cell wall biosynthesis